MRVPEPEGFTLVEIMIVAAVMAVLALIALPSFDGAIKKARRAEGRNALLQLMQQQERYFTLHTTYIAFSSDSSNPDEKKFKWFSGEKPKDSAYELSAKPCVGDTIQHCVLLQAVPGTAKVNQNFQDSVCGSLTLTSTGVKSAAADGCW